MTIDSTIISPNITAPQAKVLAINSLNLQNYRNHRQLSLKFAPQPVIITGCNGAGKTNILEAISMLSPGRGLRNAKLDEICYHSPETREKYNWQLRTYIETIYGELEITSAGAANEENNVRPHR